MLNYAMMLIEHQSLSKHPSQQSGNTQHINTLTQIPKIAFYIINVERTRKSRKSRLRKIPVGGIVALNFGPILNGDDESVRFLLN